MNLTSGSTLGPYEIIAPAGAGGMGEVYRARDTRLDPHGRYLIVALSEGSGVRLVRVPLDGAPEREIVFESELRPAAHNTLASNAIGRDGRVLVRATRRDSWYWPTAILDPATGRLEQLWPHVQADFYSGWTDDGRAVSIAMTTSSNLWRFTPAASPSSGRD